MKAKKIRQLVLLLCCCVAVLRSQAQVTVSFNPVALNTLAIDQLWNFQCINQGAASVINLHLILKSEQGNMILSSVQKGLTLNGGVSFFNRFQGAGLISYGNTPEGNTLKNGGQLTSGNFNWCVKIEAVDGGAILSESCEPLSIASAINPFLIIPFNKQELETRYPTLQWAGPIAASISPVGDNSGPELKSYYRLVLTKVREQQSPEEAINGNIPVLVKDQYALNLFQYPASAQELETATDYAWQVSYFENGKLKASSEIWTFHIKEKKEKTRKSATYFEVSKTLDGGFYLSDPQVLRIKFDDSYGSGALQYRIIDEKGNIINTQELVVKSYGSNKYDIPVKKLKLKKNTLYLLEVTTEKNRKYYLKFKIKPKK